MEEYDKKDLCEKITSIYPDIGVCGIDIDVDYIKDKNSWLVSLRKENHALSHYLDMPEADNCMEGKECVSLGLEIAQLRKNIKGDPF